MSESESRNGTPCLPVDIIVNHLLPFLDRATFDACLLLNQEVYRLSRHLPPPWPREAKRRLPHEISCVDACHFAIACGCQTGSIFLIVRRNGQRVELRLPTASQEHVAARPTAIAFSSDGTQLAIGRVDGSIQILHFVNREDEEEEDKTITQSFQSCHWKDYSRRNIFCITLQRRHTTPIHSLVFWGDHRRFLVSTSDLDSVYFWQTTNGDCMGSILGYQMGFSAIALSPNKQTLAGIDWDGSLCLYPISNHVWSKHRILPLQGTRSLHPGLAMTTHLQFSQDGKRLFGIRNGDLQHWNSETGEHSLLYSRNGAATTAVLSPDGTYLARYHKGMICIESMERQAISHICKKVTAQKWTLVFSQDGRMLVAGGVDGQLQFWNNYRTHFIYESSAQKHHAPPVNKYLAKEFAQEAGSLSHEGTHESDHV